MSPGNLVEIIGLSTVLLDTLNVQETPCSNMWIGMCSLLANPYARSLTNVMLTELAGTNASVWTNAQRIVILYIVFFVCDKRITAQMFLSRPLASHTYALIKVRTKWDFAFYLNCTGSTQHAFLQAARCIRMNTYHDRSQSLHNPFSPTVLFIVAKMSLPKRSGPYWSNPPFVIYDIRALWRSILSARVSECQKN